MAHECLGCDNSELIIPFLVSLENNGHHLALPLDQVEVKLLTELQSCNLVIKHSNVFILLVIVAELVSHHVGLMAQCDASEELD